MAYHRKNHRKINRKDTIDSIIRKKMGLTQAQFAALSNSNRTQITHFESGKRSLDPTSSAMIVDIQLQFLELETGSLSNYRSLETNLFLNEAYKRALPEMTALEKECRRKIKELKKDLEEMKQKARDMEHTIIIFTRYVNKLQEQEKQDKKTEQQVIGFNLFKQQAYDLLLTCWEPEQAKLHGKIEALSGEAKALRRYRTKVVKEHNPFKK